MVAVCVESEDVGEHFLEFVKVIRQVVLIKNNDDLQKLSWGKIHPQIKKMIESNMGNVPNNLFTQEQMWKLLK